MLTNSNPPPSCSTPSAPAPIATPSLRCDLSRLRAKGLVEKLPHSRRYRLLPNGYSICLVFLKLFERVYASLTAGLLSPVKPDARLHSQHRSQLDRNVVPLVRRHRRRRSIRSAAISVASRSTGSGRRTATAWSGAFSAGLLLFIRIVLLVAHSPIHGFASPQLMPACDLTRPFTGAPGKVSRNALYHRLLEKLGRLLGVILVDLEHDLVGEARRPGRPRYQRRAGLRRSPPEPASRRRRRRLERAGCSSGCRRMCWAEDAQTGEGPANSLRGVTANYATAPRASHCVVWARRQRAKREA